MPQPSQSFAFVADLGSRTAPGRCLLLLRVTKRTRVRTTASGSRRAFARIANVVIFGSPITISGWLVRDRGCSGPNQPKGVHRASRGAFMRTAWSEDSACVDEKI